MSRENNKLPRLRFPEFLDAGDWEEKRLGEVASFSKGKGISKADIIVDGKNKCIRYGELYTVYNDNEIIKNVVSLTNTEIGRSVLSEKNDILMPTSDVTPNGLATASALDETGIILGGDILIIRTPRILNSFFCYFVSSHKNKIMRLVSGVTVYHIYGADMATLRLNFPTPQEQQKIAACLSSLDDLITAQTQKLAHLKTHKKGLMQQLFPAEGETLPRLRFPEFCDAGDWESRELGEFISERSEHPNDKIPLYSLTIEDGVTQKTERYERSFLVKNKKEAYKLVHPNDFAFNPMNLRFGAIARHSGTEKVALSKYYNIFYCDKTVDSVFCNIYFRSGGMMTHYDNMAIGSLIEKRRVHFKDFLRFNICFPTLPEQQKIADCLSSLDELITAQTQKLAHLKTHKKGLMQQLFPATDEVNG